MSRAGHQRYDRKPFRHWTVHCIWSSLERHVLPPLFSTRCYRHSAGRGWVKQVVPVVNPGA
eukprot:1232130-Lingulodinium_polyedra.AAC.1